MKVLSVNYIFPPLQLPRAISNLKLLQGLIWCGADVEAVCVNPETYRFPGTAQFDPELAGRIPSSCKVSYVNSPECNFIFRNLNQKKLLSKLFIPVTQPIKKEWAWAAQRFLQKRKSSEYDALITISQPHVNHLIGLWLKKRWKEIPWIAYFSDPWIDNPYWEGAKNLRLKKYHQKLQNNVVNGADVLIFTSQETVDLVMDRYEPALKKKCRVLPHAFVPGWYNDAENQCVLPPCRKRIRLLHTGNFYGKRTPIPLLDAMKKMGNADIELVFIGGMQTEYAELAEKQSECVLLQPTIPYLRSLKALKESDWLVLVDAPSPDGPSPFLPSKLIDYLGSGKPILGVTPENGASARVLRNLGHIVVDVNRPDDLLKALSNIVSNTNGYHIGNPDRYSIATVGAEFVEYIRQAITGDQKSANTTKKM